MSDKTKDTIGVDVPESSYKPIPHYHKSIDMALNLGLSLLAMKNVLFLLRDDLRLQVADNPYYKGVEVIIENLASAALDMETLSPDEFVEMAKLWAIDDGNPAKALAFMMIASFPDEAMEAIYSLVHLGIRQGGDE